MIKKTCKYIIICAIIPLIVFLSMLAFRNNNYNVLSIIIVILAIIPCVFVFEKKRTKAREIVIIAVFSALSVVGRLVFMAVPAFKPVTAIVIIAGIVMGCEAGFLVGTLSAFVSNMFFGHGAWTPFQMFAWGILGFIVGLVAKSGIMKYRASQIIAGIIGGVVFSLIMDIWTVLSIDKSFNFMRYITFVVSSFPFMAMYAVSNVIFLLLLAKPIISKMERIKIKYGVF